MSSEHRPSGQNSTTHYVDCRRLTMSPVKLAIHDLVDDPVFSDDDLILKQLQEILSEEAKRRRLPS